MAHDRRQQTKAMSSINATSRCSLERHVVSARGQWNTPLHPHTQSPHERTRQPRVAQGTSRSAAFVEHLQPDSRTYLRRGTLSSDHTVKMCSTTEKYKPMKQTNLQRGCVNYCRNESAVTMTGIAPYRL